MNGGGVRSGGLQSILTKQLLAIAAVVVAVNVGFVAIFDASDRDSLVIELVRRELVRLEIAYRDADQRPEVMLASLGDLYDDHPKAYAFAVVASDGAILTGKNVSLIRSDLLRPSVFATDWMAWPSGAASMPVVASHSVTYADQTVSIVFLMADDPAGLVGVEIKDEFIGHVWLPLLPIAVLLIGGTILIVRRALRPVAQAAEWARSIVPGSRLTPLDLPWAPAEVEDLTQAVRRSLERLDAELSAEQRRAAEAAHALRTPIAVLVARLDGLPKGAQFDTIRQDVRALSRMVTQFLSSSGADRLAVPGDARADLAQIAERVVGDLFPLADAQGSEIVLCGNEAPVHVNGLPDAIALALANLIENALNHGGTSLVEVAVGPGAEVTVRDHGPGFPSIVDGTFFEPFRRGAGAPRGGAGLGLAIVDRIQRAHGGKVEIGAAPGGGAVVRLTYRSV